MKACLFLFIAVVSTSIVGCRSSDDTDISNPQFPVTNDPDAFAQFLNNRAAVPFDGVVNGEIDNVKDFPEAYYNTIDPNDSRDTLQKWQIANGFLNADGTPANCDPGVCRETHVKFRDTKDLGYGRNMFLRWNLVTGDVAIYVENFQVDAVPGVPYGPLNFDALVENDRQWNFGVNAIEFSAFPNVDPAARKFAKFYNFAGDGIRSTDPAGVQQHFVDLDNRGLKPMPTTCIVCHGGRGRTLVVENADGQKVLAPTLVDGIPGDVQAHLQMIELDTLEFSDEVGFRRQDNEDGIRLINSAVLSTYQHRRDNFTGSGDWSAEQAIELVLGRYGNDPGNPDNGYNENFVPSAWQGDENLFRSLAGPNCIVCHALRGTQANDSVAFPSLDTFRDYASRTDHLVYERGLMPLGLLNYSNFWDSDTKDPAAMANALELSNRVDADGRAVRPGAPVATITAPIVTTGVDSANNQSIDIAISGAGSAFALPTGFRWEVTPSDSATVVNNGINGDALLRVNQPGNYTLTLTVNGVNGGSDTASQIIQVRASNQAGAQAPGSQVSYFGENGIHELLQSNCISCHAPGTGFQSMPVHYTACQSDVFNGNEFLYRSVLARVNFDSPLDSLLLRKGANGATDTRDLTNSQIDGYHGGGYRLPDDASYSQLVSWILNGAPSGTIPSANSIDPLAPQCVE